MYLLPNTLLAKELDMEALIAILLGSLIVIWYKIMYFVNSKQKIINIK